MKQLIDDKKLLVDNFILKHKNNLSNNLSPGDVPVGIVELLVNKASSPSVRHLKACKCGDKFLDKYVKIATSNALELYKARNLKERDVDGSIMKLYMNKAKNDTSYELLYADMKEFGYKCPVEAQLILDFLTQYSSKYDLSDADVFNIVEPLLDFKLTIFRYELFSKENDFIVEKYDKHGNQFYDISPLEDMKLKFNIARTNAVEKLNRMIEGSKSVVVSIDESKVFDRASMYGYIDSNTK